MQRIAGIVGVGRVRYFTVSDQFVELGEPMSVVDDGGVNSGAFAERRGGEGLQEKGVEGAEVSDEAGRGFCTEGEGLFGLNQFPRGNP